MSLITKTAEGTLARIPVGDSAVIAALDTTPTVARRLQELGLRPGQRVSIMQSTAGGGRVIKVATSRYALSAGALRGIKVSVA